MGRGTACGPGVPAVVVQASRIRRRGAVPVMSYNGVWAERGHAEQQHVAGVRVDGSVAVIMTGEA